ncbi:uncharacterized protein AB9X84_025878 isoform 3-T3 [Acanthopagrus schlegelii]
MRGLLSLTLMVFILIESTKEQGQENSWTQYCFGCRTPSGGEGFNSTNMMTINSTVATELPTVRKKVVADGVREAIKNNLGFRPQPANGKDTKSFFGLKTPTSGGGFNSTNNTTINSTMATALPVQVVADGVREAIKNNLGFKPQPANGEDTKGHTAPTQTQKPRMDLSAIIPLENENGFRPKPTDGNVDQEKQK